MRVPLGSTHLGLELSDLTVVVVALAALRRGAALRLRALASGPCRSGSLRLGSCVWLLARSESLVHLVTAAKFSEYALLAARPPLLLRRRADWELVAAAVVAWSAAATCFALLQFFGVHMAGAWAAGRRQPSFLGHSDFAALSARSRSASASRASLLANRRVAWIAASPPVRSA